MSKQGDNFENDLELKLDVSTGSLSSFNSSSTMRDQNESIKGKRILIIGGSIVLFMLVAYLLTRSLSHSSHSDIKDGVNSAPTSKVKYESVMVDFPEIVTNLAPTNDKESYIKLLLTLELINTKDQDAVDKRIHLLKDTIIIFLRELRAADLTSAGGSMMLKAELIKRINKILYPVEIKDVLFKEIFVNQ